MADANTQAMWDPVLTWFRVAVTEGTANGNPPVIGVTPTTTNVPGEQAGLRSFVREMKSKLKVKAGLAPGVTPLSDVQFVAGVADLRSTIQGTSDARLAADKARANKTLTDVHGKVHAEQVQCLCGAPDDAGIPKIHTLFAKGEKQMWLGSTLSPLLSLPLILPSLSSVTTRLTPTELSWEKGSLRSP